MRNLILLVSAVSLSGCITSSSSGVSQQGKPVVATVDGGVSKKVRLEFDGGPTCNGIYEGSAQSSPKTFPLTCTDGTQGTGEMSATDSAEGIVGKLDFSLKSGATGTVRLVLGETIPTADDKAEQYRKTCRSANVSGKASLAFNMRVNGLSRNEARAQMGDASPGTVGHIVREAAIDAAYSSSTESASEAANVGIAYCVDRWEKQTT